MRYMKLTNYTVSKDNYHLIKKALGGYVFNRISDEGEHIVRLDAEQRGILDKLRICYQDN